MTGIASSSRHEDGDDVSAPSEGPAIPRRHSKELFYVEIITQSKECRKPYGESGAAEMPVFIKISFYMNNIDLYLDFIALA
jgi:hypothetical protein